MTLSAAFKDYGRAFIDFTAAGCIPIYTGHLFHPQYLPQHEPLSIILPCRFPSRYNESVHHAGGCYMFDLHELIQSRHPIRHFYQALGTGINREQRTGKTPAVRPFCRLDGSTNSERRMTELGSPSGYNLRVFLLHLLSTWLGNAREGP